MPFSFSDHVELLRQFLAGRDAIVNASERQILNAQGKAIARNSDRDSLDHAFEACFFESPAVSPQLRRLRGQLATAHLADGFEPARLDGYSRDLNPVELILRAWHHWERNRWPGRNGRIEYAHSLYAAFLLRQLQYLSLRIWEQDASERLSQLQGLLDTLNAGMRGPWVRDVR